MWENNELLQDVLVQVLGELAANRKTAARYPTVLLQSSPTSSSSSISLSRFPSTNFLHTNIALAGNRDLGKKCWCRAGSVYDGTKCVRTSPTRYKHHACKTYFTNGVFPMKQNMVFFFIQFGRTGRNVFNP